ncbi:MAG: ribonuclease E/G [Paracoccaceae bacterium]
MKGRVAILGRFLGREAAALVENGRLEDLIVAPPDGSPPGAGAVFRALPDRPAKGQGGVFLRLPGGVSGFLRETGGIAPGRPVIVQATGVAEPGKAAPLTRRVVFTGRLAIVTPGAPGRNISRRVRDATDRARLEAVLAGLPGGEEPGLILRGAARSAEAGEIAAEIAALTDLCARVMSDLTGPPELLLDAPDPHERARRDWSDPPPDAVESGDGAFADLGIDGMVADLLLPGVALAGGGSMTIEPTRALIAVDVNTGGDMSAAAGLKANIAAAHDLPRQLRLRGLGGQITVDFAPMPKRHRPQIAEKLRAAFRAAGDDVTLAGWTPLGNFELQRRRDSLPLARAIAVAGTGEPGP